MEGYLTGMERPRELRPGMYCRACGRRLSLLELSDMRGKLALLDRWAASRPAMQVIRVLKVARGEEGRVLIYDNGSGKPGYLPEKYFAPDSLIRVFAIGESGGQKTSF